MVAQPAFSAFWRHIRACSCSIHSGSAGLPYLRLWRGVRLAKARFALRIM